MTARRIGSHGRIGRNPQHTANILRALIAVDRFVVHIRRRDDVAHCIAFDDFAIHAGLSGRQIRPRRREAQPAHRVDARALLAEIVHRQHRAIARRIATDALAVAIAYQRVPTRKTLRFIGIAGNAVRANVLRTQVVVFRNVGIQVFNHGSARPITYHLPAIADGLHRYRCTHRRKRLPAGIVDARALLALIVRGQVHAIRSYIAFNAGAQTIANRRLADDARRSHRNRRIRRYSIRANIIGTRIHVDRNIHVVNDRGINAHLTNMHVAITRRLLESRRRHSIDLRKRTRAVARIA